MPGSRLDDAEQKQPNLLSPGCRPWERSQDCLSLCRGLSVWHGAEEGGVATAAHRAGRLAARAVHLVAPELRQVQVRLLIDVAPVAVPQIQEGRIVCKSRRK